MDWLWMDSRSRHIYEWDQRHDGIDQRLKSNRQTKYAFKKTRFIFHNKKKTVHVNVGIIVIWGFFYLDSQGRENRVSRVKHLRLDPLPFSLAQYMHRIRPQQFPWTFPHRSFSLQAYKKDWYKDIWQKLLLQNLWGTFEAHSFISNDQLDFLINFIAHNWDG